MQELKPSDLIGFCGTTEVASCYKASDDGVFPATGENAPPLKTIISLVPSYDFSSRSSG